MSIEELLGLELRNLRLGKGWSQETLAFESGVNRNYISMIELGRHSPSFKVLFKLCTALDASPSLVVKAVELAAADASSRQA